MKFNKKIWYLTATVLVVLNACTQKLINLSKTKADIAEYYENGQYEKETEEVVKDAINKLSRLQIPPNAAAVFDIDETVLSNYNHIKSVDFGYIKPLWDEYVHSGKASAIKSVKKLYDWLLENNIKIYFLTGRYDTDLENTRKNLIEEGFSQFEDIIVRSSAGPRINAVEYKSEKRREIAAKGHKIIICVGDQMSDLLGENTGIKIKIPNYLYFIE